MAKKPKVTVNQYGSEITLVSPVGGRVVPLVKDGHLLPRARTVRRPTNPKAALAELSRVYTDARRGQLPVEEAARLSYMLKNAADVHRDHVLTAKVDALKESVEKIVKALQEQGSML